MKDFTLNIYTTLLDSLKESNYEFQRFDDFINAPKEKVVILRHDVDARNLHSLAFAKIQHEKGILGTYYFRMVPQSFDEEIIKEIQSMGHEIGYHYEDMDFANGDSTKAIEFFENHLEKLRSVANISTICMHGSPKSKYDNKDIWNKYDYKKYDIIAEPYFDIDFNSVFYLTDTGRRWDGHKVSVRDKVKSNEKFPVFHHTNDIINAIELGELPSQVMFNFHPQRWTDNKTLWYRDRAIQNIKNPIKKLLIQIR